jgi:hypothetical protein
MLARYGIVAVVLVSLGLISRAPLLGAVVESAGSSPCDRFPVGTVLVLFDGVHDRTFYATEKVIREQRTGAEFACQYPESMELSPDGNRLLVRLYDTESLVLRSSDLHLVRRLDTPYSWWEGSRLGYLRIDDHGNCYLFTGGRESRVASGEVSPGHTRILSADSTGRYFLGVYQLNRGNEENGFSPTNRLQLWTRMRNGKLRLVRSLATTEYDPGSVGDPHRLAVLSERAVVFGFPLGMALGEDLIGVLQGRRVIAPLKSKKGEPLLFMQAPLTTPSAIVGLAATMGHGTQLFDQTSERYFYRVSEKGFALQPVATNVVFVTYHPRRRQVGFGVADKDGVSIHWGNPTAP